jgi:hypothetical protein
MCGAPRSTYVSKYGTKTKGVKCDACYAEYQVTQRIGVLKRRALNNYNKTQIDKTRIDNFCKWMQYFLIRNEVATQIGLNDINNLIEWHNTLVNGESININLKTVIKKLTNIYNVKKNDKNIRT